ncbi:MAG TPA: hypothetical protein VKG03_00180 [Solirubrobacterales bacterium]|nr:hypothetical protein [Solirubrobacterales bacterium]
MRRHSAIGTNDSARVTRISWLTMFVAPMMVMAILVLAKSAQALSLQPASAAAAITPFGPESDGPEEEEEIEECEEEELEGEECEEEAGAAPAECLLRTAEGRAVAFTTENKVGLAIRYTSFSPTEATVSYRLHGSRGSLTLGSKKEHLGRRGVIRDVERLTDSQVEKARAASEVTVWLHVPATPDYCHSSSTLRLTTRRSEQHQLVWTQPGSALRH